MGLIRRGKPRPIRRRQPLAALPSANRTIARRVSRVRTVLSATTIRTSGDSPGSRPERDAERRSSPGRSPRQGGDRADSPLPVQLKSSRHARDPVPGHRGALRGSHAPSGAHEAGRRAWPPRGPGVLVRGPPGAHDSRCDRPGDHDLRRRSWRRRARRVRVSERGHRADGRRTSPVAARRSTCSRERSTRG